MTNPPISQRSELVRSSRWLFSWRGLRRILIIMAWAATIVGLLYGVENWRGRRAWNKYRSELEARGEQLDYRAFIPKAVPDEQNFAATPLIQSWFIKRSNYTWPDDFSRAGSLIHKPMARTGDPATWRFSDLEAWEMAFAAAATWK